MPAVLVKIAYSAQNSARTPLLCSNSARYPKKFSAPRAVFIFANIVRNLGLVIHVTLMWIIELITRYFSICFLFSFKFFLQLLCKSLAPLTFPYSAQILLEKALFCRQNARLINRLFCPKFCRQNLSKPKASVCCVPFESQRQPWSTSWNPQHRTELIVDLKQPHKSESTILGNSCCIIYVNVYM